MITKARETRESRTERLWPCLDEQPLAGARGVRRAKSQLSQGVSVE